MASKQQISSDYRYILFKISPGVSEILSLRKLFEDALMQSFGLSRAGTYIDVLWIAEDGEEAVIRIAEQDAQALLGAVVAVTKVRISLIEDGNSLSKVIKDDPSKMIDEQGFTCNASIM